LVEKLIKGHFLAKIFALKRAENEFGHQRMHGSGRKAKIMTKKAYLSFREKYFAPLFCSKRARREPKCILKKCIKKRLMPFIN